MMPFEIGAFLVRGQPLEPVTIERVVEQVDPLDPGIGAQFDNLGLAIKHLAVLAQRDEVLGLDRIGQDRAAQLEQAAD